MRVLRIAISVCAAYLYIASSMFTVGPALSGRGNAADVSVSISLVCAFLLVLLSFYFRRHRPVLLGFSIGCGILVPCLIRITAPPSEIFRNDASAIVLEFLLMPILLFLFWQGPLKAPRR
jgi:hypothetical protein